MLPRAQVRQVLSHATVFACPSVYEPLGIVNLEAMATETAVVASAVGGIPEVVVDGVTGYLVPYDPAQADDPEAIAAFEEEFATKINALTTDPEKAREFGLAGTAALHRGVRLVQDRRGDRRGLPPRARGSPKLVSCLLSLFTVRAAQARTSRRSPRSTYDPVSLPRRPCECTHLNDANRKGT